MINKKKDTIKSLAIHDKDVGTGLECGISIKDFIDFKEKDVIESFLAEEVQRSI